METLIAGTIVLLVLLSLLGTIGYGLQGTRDAEGNQEAVFHARTMLELIRERRLAQNPGFSDPATARIPLDSPPFEPKPRGEDFPADSGYTRRVVTSQLSADPADYRSKVYRIDVTVFWKVKDRENSFHLVGYYRAP